jgi:hypothetical protein
MTWYRTMGKSRPLQFLAVVAAGLVTTHFFHVRPAAHAAPALTDHRIPGLSLDLPDWQTGTTAQTYEIGDLELNGPRGRNTSASLIWATDVGEGSRALRTVEKALSIQKWQKDLGVFEVSGHPAHRWRLETTRGGATATVWQCPEDRRTFRLLLNIDLPVDEVERLTDAIVKSVHCHLSGRRLPQAAHIPTFQLRDGWSKVESKNEGRYIGPSGQRLAIGGGQPGDANSPDKFADVREEYRWAKETLALFSGGHGPESAVKRTLVDESGHTRNVWFDAKAEADGQWAGTTVMMTWFCPIQNRTYTAIYTIGFPGDLAQAEADLLEVRCH